MAKIDVFLRSIERFGATGAVLTSGEAVTLRFAQGDRHATTVTPHDQVVMIVREVAPPTALEQIDKHKPATFEHQSNGNRFTLTVTPGHGVWQLAIESVGAAPVAPAAAAPAKAAAVANTTGQVSAIQSAPAAPSAGRQPRAATASGGESDMAIERGQYAESGPRATSGSAMLDHLTAAARAARATDVYLATGAAPTMRAGGGELQPLSDRGSLDAETISRELGVVAPADARATWTAPIGPETKGKGVAVFTYGDGLGRVRATLTRDLRGPGASLRLLVAEPPALERLGVAREVAAWLDERSGLVLVAGPSGSGKTTTLASLVQRLGEKRRRVVTFEDPIEIIHVTSPWVSQRAIGEHVPGVAAGVAGAMREAADAIVIDSIGSTEAAAAAVDAVAAGHFVLATIAAATARHAVDHLVELLPYDRRDLARGALEHGLLGTIAPVVKGGGRSFEVVAGRGG